MKYILSLVLFCLIFQNIMAINLSRKMELAKFALTLRAMVLAKEKKLRQLQGTDKGDEPEETDTTVETTPPATSYNPTPNDQPETGEATAENGVVPADKPIKQTKITDNKTARVQFSKFHGFIKPTKKGPGEVNFKTFVYFFGRPIAYYIILRLRILYSNGGLRSLQNAQAESARTDCEIVDKSLAGKVLSEDEGKNINYNCKVNATMGDASTASFALNPDIPLTIVNANGTIESVDFKDINFNGDTGEAATNLEEGSAPEITGKVYTIKEAIAFYEGYILKIAGKCDESRRLRNLLSSGENVEMNIANNDDKIKTYTCTFEGSTTGGDAELSCNTQSDPLRTTVGKMHLSSGKAGDDLLSIEMDNLDGNSTHEIYPTGGSNRYYSKSSSGLSGGAIAGIVIACVVALAAASIAAIMLRKPTPPIDNTTVVNLKSENI